MSDQPKEPEKTKYQRDKTAKGPQPAADAPKIPAKPKPKIKKTIPAMTITAPVIEINTMPNCLMSASSSSFLKDF